MVTLLANELQVGDFVAFEGNGKISEMLEIVHTERQNDEEIFLIVDAGADRLWVRVHPFDDVRVSVRGNR